MVQKRLELDFSVAQDIRVRRAAGFVFTQKFGKYAVFVVGCRVDVFYFNAQYIGYCGCINKVNIR